MSHPIVPVVGSVPIDCTLTTTGAEPRPKLATIDGDGELPNVVTSQERWDEEVGWQIGPLLSIVSCESLHAVKIASCKIKSIV
jgi:hypothetical protein